MVSAYLMDQIEEGKEEYPDDIDEVPVEAHHFHRGVIVRTEVTAPGAPDEPQQQTNADNHVQRVQAGHPPVEDHEQFDLRRELRMLMPGEVRSGKQTFVPMCVVLVALDGQKDAAEEERDNEHSYSSAAVRQLRVAD